MDAEPGEALADRHHFQRVNVDMFRQIRDPPHRFGDIFRRQRLGVLVSFTGFRIVAFKTDVGELGAAYQARLDIGDANRGAVQISAQIQAELAYESFGRAVDVAAVYPNAARLTRAL